MESLEEKIFSKKNFALHYACQNVNSYFKGEIQS